MAAGVIVCLLVVGIATAIVIVILVLFQWRRQRQKDLSTTSPHAIGGEAGFENQLYGRGTSINSLNGRTVMLTAPKEVQESALHDYAIVEPDKAGDGYYEDMSVSYV